MPTVISVEHLSKTYRLGQIGTGTFTNDLKLWWAKARGKPNPLAKIGEMPPPLRPSPNTGGGDGGEGDTIWALKDVSFTVEQGEVLGIIGRNGAGKSTLLKILSRVTAPTSGKIKVKGRVASLLEVGTGFHPELTGRENIYLNGAILGMSKAEVTRKFDEIVDFAEVEKFIDTPVKRYSSGMYVRLAFAVAAHLDPEILLVDEVLAVGDTEFRKKCLGKMGDMALTGRTVFFVSHNLAVVQTLCTKVYYLNNGRIEADGEPARVIHQYQENGYQRVTSQLLQGTQIIGARLIQKPNTIYTSLDPLTAEMEIFTEVKLPSAFLNFVIENSSGQYLVHLRTDVQGLSPTFLPGQHRIRIHLPLLGLRSGIYSAWFRLYVNSEDQSIVADSEHLLLEINGVQTSGLIDIPGKWSWESLENTRNI
ncbi:MAG: polysaccharide ABC transporter ATP-binding protein [Chloroflexota bacterium]